VIGAEAAELGAVPIVDPATSIGHLLRRAQRVHTDLWASQVQPVTGPQYAMLVAVAGWDNVDQARAGLLASLDKSTAAEIVRRLHEKGWLDRQRGPHDARRWLQTHTARSQKSLAGITTGAREVQAAVVLRSRLQDAPGGAAAAQT